MTIDWAAVNAIASAFTALAVLVAVLQLRGARQQAHREFENLYVQRFWTVSDDFSSRVRRHMPNKFAKAEVPSALAYLQLCEDEIDVRGLGRITNDTWAFWESAIRAEVAQDAYKDLLQLTDPRFSGVRELLRTGKDPLRWRALRRWVGGL